MCCRFSQIHIDNQDVQQITLEQLDGNNLLGLGKEHMNNIQKPPEWEDIHCDSDVERLDNCIQFFCLTI